MQLSPHFWREEFACACGCGFDTVDCETLRICEEVRKFTGKPVTVTSGCRCSEHNKAIGGAAKSKHVEGRAADLQVEDPSAVYKYLDSKYPDKYGFGLYTTFVHIDTRTDGPVRWIGK